MGILENSLFGTKELFAIELGDFSPSAGKGRVRFWIQGKSFGDFKKSHKVSYTITGIKKLMQVVDDLSDSEFAKKTEKEIFSLCLLDGKDRNLYTEEDYNRIKKFMKFSFFFGEQFGNVTNIIHQENGVLHFIWSLNNDYSGRQIDYLKNMETAQTTVLEFKKVSSDFLSYSTRIFN